jgi:hypothetical protein
VHAAKPAEVLHESSAKHMVLQQNTPAGQKKMAVTCIIMQPLNHASGSMCQPASKHATLTKLEALKTDLYMLLLTCITLTPLFPTLSTVAQ